MEIEYHYYITYIIARRAGFSGDKAYKIAYASQYVDDNKFDYEIHGADDIFVNAVSQTEDITKPKESLLRIYPLFHFLPGTLDEVVAHYKRYPRRDGKLHIFNTIPGNSNAKSLMETALNSSNLYRIGIATHMLADTFSHQNFVGIRDECNAMTGILEKLLPAIGHAKAKYQPDWPAHEWTDDRCIAECAPVVNKTRFLEASECIFDLYCSHTALANAEDIKMTLKAELSEMIGEKDINNKKSKDRLARYKTSIGEEFKEYKKDTWFDEAIKFERDPMTVGTSEVQTLYSWRDQDTFTITDWYQFQEAVRTHQNEAERILQPTFAMSDIA